MKDISTYLKPEIQKNSTVRYKDCWKVVTARFKNTVNLGYVWDGSKNRVNGVPITEVEEDFEGFYKNWIKSESYQCM
jgi:hypothetical protein